MAPERNQPGEVGRAILGAEPTMRADQVAGSGEGDLEVAKRLWRALGFPAYDDEDPAFTLADRRALHVMQSAIANGDIDFDTGLNLTRAVGATMARLADWEVATVVPRIDELSDEATRARALGGLRELQNFNPAFEELLVYVWRRHLSAAVSRVEGALDDTGSAATEVAVGFADLVGFTKLSNSIGHGRIGDLVEVFESRVHDVIASNRGRAIKSLGDSVLFINESPVRAIETAEGIISVIGRDERLPDVRLGMAWGPVVTRLGDVFGPAVNLAARLTPVARRNRLIVDAALAAQLPEEFESRRLPARPLRGFGLVEPVTVRRH